LTFRTLVLGIGNNLLTDEGVGIHTVNYLSQRYPQLRDVEFMDGGTLSFSLAEPISQADGLIVVDAARLDTEPGTIRQFEGADMDSYLKGHRGSVHEVGLAELIDMSRLTGDMPDHRCLIGIQPLSLDWGETPSAEVSAAIPTAAGMVMETIRRWTTTEPVID
jgi:hydrogenase maturation protease